MAVGWARGLGYQAIATVGFSMGASVVLRHAGLIGGLDAVVSVSGPGRWYYRGTEQMRWVHRAVEHRAGRYVTRRWLKTRISPEGWQLIPVPPAEAAAKIAPVPLLIVHGDQDHYFPPEHARQLYMAAREPKELWLLPGMGHAESACSQEPRRPHRPLARRRRPAPDPRPRPRLGRHRDHSRRAGQHPRRRRLASRGPLRPGRARNALRPRSRAPARRSCSGTRAASRSRTRSSRPGRARSSRSPRWPAACR